jgi:GT2 family glycosyltransferase
LGPELSIVIPSHRRPDVLQTCLHSVLRHAPKNTQVLVVDDGSSGASATVVARQFAGVQVVRRRHGGFCAAANTGILAASGEVVELLNDDTRVTAGWAEAALQHFREPAIGAVAPLVLRWPGNEVAGPRIDSAGDRYYLGGIAGKRGRGERVGAPYLSPRHVFGASASSAFYRRDALLRVGGFPETFTAYFEDVDLAFRLNRAGYRARFEPAAKVWHQVAASYGKPRRRLLEQQSCNEERVFWRNLPGPVLRRALPLHLAVLAGKTWRRCQEGGLAPFLWGRLRVLAEAPALLRHRHWLSQLGPSADVANWGVESRFWA